MDNEMILTFLISEELFQRIKAHLERETQRTGRKLTQREFVLGLIEEALEAAERQVGEASPEPEEPPQEEDQQDEDALQLPDTPSQGGVEPCEGEEGLPDSQDE